MFLPNQAELLQLFSSFLSEAGLSTVSIKNYLCDLRHFLKNYYSTPSLYPYTHRARPYRDSNPSRPGLEGPEVTVKDIFQNLNQYLDPYLQAQKAAFTPKTPLPDAWPPSAASPPSSTSNSASPLSRARP